MVSGLHGTSYGDRLNELGGFLSLRSRRVYFDLVETFKCIRGYSKVGYKQWFLLEKDLECRATHARESPLNILLPDEMKENSSLESLKT